MRIQCRPAVSGSHSGKVHREANTKLRPKLDRILPFQVPSVYLPKPRKRPANTYLKTPPPVSPIITQFAFSLGKEPGPMPFIASSLFLEDVPSILMRIAIGGSTRNSKRQRSQGTRYFPEIPPWNIPNVKRCSKDEVWFLVRVSQQISSKKYYDIDNICDLKILGQRMFVFRLMTKEYSMTTHASIYVMSISYVRRLSKF